MYKDKRCILIADDEIRMVRALKDFLNSNNFHVETANNGQEALDMFYEKNLEIDLVLLDVMMPKYNGFEVLKDMRENYSFTPVIMLTARGEEYDQLKGFNSGADDYVTKPFSPSLLLARIESVLRRVGKSEEEEISKGSIILNSTKRIATCKGSNLELTKKEFDLLLFFMTNNQMIFTRDQLLNSVWGYDFEGDERTVDTHVKQLRTKLNGTDYIKTVYGVGYKMEA